MVTLVTYMPINFRWLQTVITMLQILPYLMWKYIINMITLQILPY